MFMTIQSFPHDNKAESASNSGCMIFISGILAVYQTIFAFLVLQQTDIVMKLAFRAEVQAVIAGFWAAMFMIATVTLVRHKPYALRYSGWLLITFVVYNLLKMFVFAQADYDRNRLAILTILSAAIIIVPLLLVLPTKARNQE